ncbi:uncharacterized protein [Dermacentor andersoni]|uniref:uncharacterized protein n=1 Tax=Dermacentor andersoni TaxID=34620 RepID=UPI00241735E6|nr:uncharacterized protein LOC129384839 [Dermacentor andersoni]
MYDAIRNHASHLLFFGAYIYTTRSGERLARETQSIPNLGLVILQTHITPAERMLAAKCTVHLISYKSGRRQRDVPTFDVVNHSVDKFRALAGNFSIMFSTSLGVMVYVAKGKVLYADNNSTGQACERGSLHDHDVLCITKHAQRAFKVNAAESVCYQIYEQYNQYHFVTWEEMNTIEAKIKDYIHKSDGWAVFHPDLDVRTLCGSDKNLERVIAFATAVKNRSGG